MIEEASRPGAEEQRSRGQERGPAYLLADPSNDRCLQRLVVHTASVAPQDGIRDILGEVAVERVHQRARPLVLEDER